jgi:tetratricopeptide (TPR) repeat protein
LQEVSMKFFFIFFLFVSAAFAQTASDYLDLANQAYEKKDYAANVKWMEKTIEAGAEHPVIFYFLARAYALNGNTDAAIQWLNKIADLGLSFKPEEDPQFAALQKMPAFDSVIKKFQANLAQTKFSKSAITFQDPKFIPEGVAYDPSDKRFYFGDSAGDRIQSFKNGVFEDFSGPKDGLWAVLGMKVDSKRRQLWASSAALAGEQKGHSGIFQYDLKSHKLLNKYLLGEGDHCLGDLEIDSKGNIYTTDSNTPAIYVLKSGSQKLEPFLAGLDFFRSPQGLALSSDEKILFVADYSRGLFGVDLASKRFWKLKRPEGATTVAGLDGLYFYKGSLIGTQNGFNPKRVLRVVIDSTGEKIEKVDVLESNHPVFPEPTLGVIVGNDLYYVGNSMIGPFLEDPKTELKPAVILDLAL